MINVFTLTNTDTTIIESKMSKTFSSEVYIKLVALHINTKRKSSSQFQNRNWLVTPAVATHCQSKSQLHLQ